MSDVVSDLPRPARPESWRDRLAGWAENLDLSPARLVGGVVVLAVVGFLGWRLLAPPPVPPEMRLPFVSTTSAPPAAGVAAGSSPPGSGSEGAASTSAPDGGQVVVHVAGAVTEPGVQRLPAGSRVVDAVEAAGGTAAGADPSRINLAAPLEDGQQVYVPRLGEVGGGSAGPGGPGTGGGAGSGSAGAAGVDAVVNINTADAGELDALPGIGPAIAGAIVDHRDQNGLFASVDELLDVRGIGDAKLADLRDRVTV